jgi:hypothetical protein
MKGLMHKVGMIRGKRSGFLNHSETAAEVQNRRTDDVESPCRTLIETSEA